MGNITLNKNNRLFWLGRYAERVYQGVENVRQIQDKLLDEKEIDIDDYCKKIGIINNFSSIEDFCNKYLFDHELAESIICSADSMIGNGMVLRELIGSPTLSYLQMAVSALEAASNSASPYVQLQWVLDDIMAFRGCYGEFIESEKIRNTIKSGASVERVSTFLRLGADDRFLYKELNKLVYRLQKTNLKYNEDCLAKINQFLLSEEEHPSRLDLLYSVESLLQI